MKETLSTLVIERDRGWLTIRLNRPHTRNALSAEMLEEMIAVLKDARRNEAIRAIALRGNGGVFCAGGDLKGFQDLFHQEAVSHEQVASYSRRSGELFHLVASMPQLVVALVEGPAMAGGIGLACASDIVIACENARFAFTETQLGIPPAQIAPIVASRLGLTRARALLILGTRLCSQSAMEAGIVDRIVPDGPALEAAQTELREALARCSASAVAATKSILRETGAKAGADIVGFAADAFADCMLSAEGREGIAAFIEKRAPAWHHRDR